VTVPVLPGVITYGRTLEEAREMARDAIRRLLEGLRKDGEPIPNEKTARKEKLRGALTASMSPRLPVLKPRKSCVPC